MSKVLRQPLNKRHANSLAFAGDDLEDFVRLDLLGFASETENITFTIALLYWEVVSEEEFFVSELLMWGVSFFKSRLTLDLSAPESSATIMSPTAEDYVHMWLRG